MKTSEINALTAPTQYIEANGISFAYRRFGKPSAIPLVGFQHFTGTLDNWDPIILDGLAAEREIIIFDNAGVGNSSGETPDNVLAMTNDAVNFIKALGISKIDVLGFSLGGFIAQYLGEQHPDLINKIIIVGAAPQGTKALHNFPELIGRAQQKEPMEIFLYIFFTSSQESRNKGKAALQRLYSRAEDRSKATTEQAVMAQMKAITQWGTESPSINLKRIPHPVLILQGSNDEMMDSDSSYTLFKELPNAILTYYPDAAHGSFYQYPEMFVSQANYFLAN
ncbi:alpha/beta fold hydrolase [Flavobacterium anhuiense]|uniref:alpha/beta fold hydrolase n=1 Tax=Flavobacterium anhuiense TaxID=459526 RepID=UPI003D98C2D5